MDDLVVETLVVDDHRIEHIARHQITIDEVLITSVSTGGSGGEDRLTENITLNFAKVKFEYVEQAPKGGKGATPSMSFNIAENTKDG